MITLKDNCFYHVGAWMRTKLNLKGVALEIFAIIYGFSQDGESKFTGSINYLCEWTGVSRPTVINTLKGLVDDDLIIKETETINGVTFSRYKANISYIVNLTGSKESLLGVVKILYTIMIVYIIIALIHHLKMMYSIGQSPPPLKHHNIIQGNFSILRKLRRRAPFRRQTHLSRCAREFQVNSISVKNF